MAMQTGKTDARGFQNILHAFESEILTHGEAELGVLATRADEFVRISFYARSNTHVNILRNAQFLGNSGNAAQFNTGVDNNAPHAGLVFAHCNALCKPVALGGHGTRRQQRLRRTGLRIPMHFALSC